jgi:DNA modification methylase
MTVTLHCGDALDVLRTLPADSVQCVVTSPPYWGLRDYGVPGQLGLERTPEEYVSRVVAVFREVRRVLRVDGVLWLNLGDSYATGAGKVGDCPDGGEQGDRWNGYCGCRGGSAKQPHTGNNIGPAIQPNRMPLPGLKPKDLVGIPWRVAFALQADGWWLRSDVIWAKPNPMPESVTDRPTKAHEYVFLMTKSERYAYHAKAIHEPLTESTLSMYAQAAPMTISGQFKGSPKDKRYQDEGKKINGSDLPTVRNARTVWTIPTQPFPEAHFATFPEALVERCIAAGSCEGDMVLDPFAGSGTVGVVCARADRSFLGIDLNPEYVEMARRRIASVAPLFVNPDTSARL